MPYKTTLYIHNTESFSFKKRAFGGVSPSELLICAREQQLPAPTNYRSICFETSMLDLGNLIFAMVRIWSIHCHRQTNICVLCTHTFKLDLFRHMDMEVIDYDVSRLGISFHVIIEGRILSL